MPKQKPKPKQCEEPQVPSVVGWGAKLIDGLANTIGTDEVLILRSQLDALTRSPTTPPLKQPATTGSVIVCSRSSLKQVANAVEVKVGPSWCEMTKWKGVAGVDPANAND